METKIFAFVVDGVVKLTMKYGTDAPDAEAKTIGLSNGPTIIETTALTEKPTIGWTYENGVFTPPVMEY